MSRALVTALAMAATACGGGGGSSPDASPLGADADTSFTPPGCDYSFGPAWVLDEIRIMPAGEGIDITGDGIPDNAMGPLSSLANPVLADGIDRGVQMFLMEIAEWSAPDRTDPDVVVSFYSGIDADSPPDPSNNLGGDGEFLLFAEQFDTSCNALGRSSSAAITDGLVEASAPRWRLFVVGVGTVEFADMRIRLQLDADLFAMGGTVGGIWTNCALARTFLAQLGDVTLLDFLVSVGVQPDMDVDGDGIEGFNIVDDRIVSCVDGDGTEIPGESCTCDPRIADGYSVSIELSGVPGAILGVVTR